MVVVNTKLPPTEKMRGWLDQVNFELKILKNGSDHPGHWYQASFYNFKFN
jgi:hypothetical protein